MNINLENHEKEVIALDADDHLLRPHSFRLIVSEFRLLQVRVDCVRMRRLPGFCAA
jgi:hypothetical protein